ncbi:MAG: 50S ribosomal protein L35 [Candidatus Paceibacteria bacterium]
MIYMSARGFRPKKSLLKRVKITRRGKILRRFTHLNHFNAKESGRKTRQKRGEHFISKSDEKSIKQLLPL